MLQMLELRGKLKVNIMQKAMLRKRKCEMLRRAIERKRYLIIIQRDQQAWYTEQPRRFKRKAMLKSDDLSKEENRPDEKLQLQRLTQAMRKAMLQCDQLSKEEHRVDWESVLNAMCESPGRLDDEER